MMFGGTRAAKKAPQTQLSPSAVAQMQEDRRREVIAALRVEAQAKFDTIGLPRGLKVIR